MSVGEVLQDSRLNERCLGALELRPARSLPAYAGGDLSFAPEGGDSYLDVVRRLVSFMLDLAGWAEAKSASRVLLSSHMGVLRILAGVFEEEHDPVAVLARSFANAELLQWEWTRLAWPQFLPR